MEHREIPGGRLARASGIEAGAFPAAALRVPAASEVRLLLDQGEIVNAYPELHASGGKGALVRLTYAEALYDANGQKGDRNDIDGKQIAGLYDELVADGGANRRFMPLWWRSWRFLELHVKTADEPLTLEGLKAFATGFPFQKRARFTSDDPELERIFDVSYRTMRLAGHETYMDAPYWEQLQYVGDTRIDALLNYTLAGEDRLARRSILHFDWSRGAYDITQSRYPTAEVQLIPPYALFFVSMVHDYWSYRGEPAFVRERLPAVRASIDWFLARLRDDGLVGFLPYWIHVDTGTSQDEAIKEEDGRSLAVTLQLVETLRQAAELEEALGDATRAALYRRRADASAAAVRAHFDADKALLPDTPERRTWGHPVNIWGLVNGGVPEAGREAAARNVLAVGRHPAGRASDGGRGAPWPLDQVPSASLYFRFYLSRALEATGHGDAYVGLLQPWRDLLAKGLTTWPEHPEPSRSDCHAWSAHPAFDLLRIVAGIKPAAPASPRSVSSPTWDRSPASTRRCRRRAARWPSPTAATASGCAPRSRFRKACPAASAGKAAPASCARAHRYSSCASSSLRVERRFGRREARPQRVESGPCGVLGRLFLGRLGSSRRQARFEPVELGPRRFRPRLRLAQPPRCAFDLATQPGDLELGGPRARERRTLHLARRSLLAAAPRRRLRRRGRWTRPAARAAGPSSRARAPRRTHSAAARRRAGRASFPKRRRTAAGSRAPRAWRSGAAGRPARSSRRPRRARARPRARLPGAARPCDVSRRAARQRRHRRALRAGRPRPPRAPSPARRNGRGRSSRPGSPPTRPPWAFRGPSRDWPRLCRPWPSAPRRARFARP